MLYILKYYIICKTYIYIYIYICMLYIYLDIFRYINTHTHRDSILDGVSKRVLPNSILILI